MKRLWITSSCVIVSLLALSSCTLSKIASDLTSGIFKDGAPAFEMEGDVEVAEVSGLALIKTIEVFNYQNPTNKTYLNLLARSYATYAFGFLETRMMQYQYTDPEKYQMYFNRAKDFYKRGKGFGMAWMSRKDKGLVRAIHKGVADVEKRMKGYGRQDLDGIFWTAFSWGGLINLSKDDIAMVADLALVEAMMARVVKVYPSFYFAGPQLFYGVYYASRPPMLGGSPEKAREHFEEASKINDGRSLMVYALEAQYLAVQTQDHALFDAMIEKINTGSIDDLPQQRLANALAKERAKFLRANEKNYF